MGIIDQYKDSSSNNMIDIFKIRSKKIKNNNKKRGTGIPSSKGAVCGTAKDKNELIKICNKLNIKRKLNNLNRNEICNIIRNHLLYLEKYNEEKIKKTYLIIPSNHPVYKFPLNLQDRINYIKDELEKKLNSKLEFNIKKLDNGIFENIRDIKYIRYKITFLNNKNYDSEIIKKYGFLNKNNIWEVFIE